MFWFTVPDYVCIYVQQHMDLSQEDQHSPQPAYTFSVDMGVVEMAIARLLLTQPRLRQLIVLYSKHA